MDSYRGRMKVQIDTTWQPDTGDWKDRNYTFEEKKERMEKINDLNWIYVIFSGSAIFYMQIILQDLI